jgi:hypothetical protein
MLIIIQDQMTIIITIVSSMMTKKMRYPSLIHYTYTKDTHIHTYTKTHHIQN